MNEYPMPIVDESKARKSASEKINGIRKNNSTHKDTAKKIFIKHGSRKSNSTKKVSKKNTNNSNQGELPI